MQKIFCPGQNYFVEDKSDFVWADGQGISTFFMSKFYKLLGPKLTQNIQKLTSFKK